ncbi:glycerate kinase [Novosphingobium sp. RD2P27]|uniref:Glycerate kinase n=1 Tax=Novosphingobium kalidii TaxID=3230299 RepID=A0ABV2D1X9_9SPHN
MSTQPVKRTSQASLADGEARLILRAMLDAAIGAADPARVIPAHLPEPPAGRCIVVGAGKASAAMAAAVEAAWPNVELSGVVAVPPGYGGGCSRITVRETAHPVPDTSSVDAAQEMMAAVHGLTSDDLVLALISGGGSAAICLPAGDLTLEDKQATNRMLLKSGLDIRTMNAIRRRLSGIKGGRLAQAAVPAKVVTLAISDIPGDDIAAIASGPTVMGDDDGADASAFLERYGSALPERVVRHLAHPYASASEPATHDVSSKLVATPADALQAAASVAVRHGIVPQILGDAVEGESSEVAQAMASRLTADCPTVFLSGGETTVTIGTGQAGRGGRNTEFALALACALQGRGDTWALAADTDGEDGQNLGAAGALIAPNTLERARSLELNPRDHLADHDSGSFFQALGDLVNTGPTRTNVNDFRAILIWPNRAG